MNDSALSLLSTLAVHSTLLLAAGWAIGRAVGERHPRLAEAAWRSALLLPLLTAPAALLLAALPSAMTAAAPAAAAAMETPGIPLRPANPIIAATTPVSTVPMSSTRPPAVTATPAAAAPNVHRLPAPDAGGWRIDADAARWLLHGWLAAAIALLLMTLSGVGGVIRLRRSARLRAAPAPLQRQADALAGTLHLSRAPRLAIHDGIASPLALPGALIVLPRWCLGLGAPQQRALLGHELAHLQRADPLWRIADRAVLAVLCWQPLAWLALRRLDALAERDCDAVAARLLGSGRPLAECLAICVGRSAARRAPRLAVAMAARDSEVVRRVQRLLKEKTMPASSWSTRQRRLFGAAAASLSALLAIAGGVAVTVDARADVVQLEYRGRGDSVRLVDIDGDRRIEMALSGRIDISDDERRIDAMADGARLQIEQAAAGIERELRLRGRAGSIERDYRIDGTVRPFDADAEAWLAQMIATLYRSGGYDAERRAQRLLQRDGAAGLLDEIARIDADHVRGIYLGVTFESTALTPAQLDRAIELMHAIGSDFELRRTLTRAIASPRLAAGQRSRVLAVSGRIGSDFERVETLLVATPLLAGDAALLAAWSESAAGIDSGFERRRLLQHALGQAPDDALLDHALRLAAAIDSDFEKRSVLDAAAPLVTGRAAALPGYVDVARTIGSDFELRTALQRLIRQGPLERTVAEAILDLGGQIDSDFERRQILVALAAAMPADAGLIERYRRLLRDMGSFERGEAERALGRFAAR